SSSPPPQATQSLPPGKVVSISSGRPVPIEPIVVEELRSEQNRRWRQIILLLLLLGSLVLSGYWWKAQLDPSRNTAVPSLAPGVQIGE
ncbi:MAG: hypothetical protein ACN4G0_02925, partial [Polyangiales bacterium]